MSKPTSSDAVSSPEPDSFRTTHWTVVATAGLSPAVAAEAALETLCRTYWYPIYAFVRRRGHPVSEAQDLTQAFFSHFLGSAALQSLDRSKGRFRSYLLGALKNFLCNEWDKARRLKRGGGLEILSWDDLHPEERFQNEPAENVPAEMLLDREWAHAVAGEALRKLRAEAVREGTELRFDVLKQYLGAGGEDVAYTATAAALNLSESAVKSAIHRLRRRFGDLFRAEVRQTVASAEDAEAEIRHLFAALGG